MALTKPRAAQIYNLDYKQATRVVTTTNITLSGSAPSLVDGVSLSLNDRVLVIGQNTASQNGLYKVTTVGSGSNGTWARTSDADNTGEIEAGMIIMVTEGTIYADTQWKLTTNDPITIGTTALTFVQNYSANSISAGTSNVVVTSNANVTISANGTANILTISNTGAYVSGIVSASGNVTGANILTAGIMSSTGNAIHGNVLTGGLISATANITGNYFIGNGSQLTGITGGGSGSSISNGTSNVNAVSSGGNITVGIGGTSNIVVWATTGQYVTGVVSATGNITGNYFFGNGSQLTGISAGGGTSITNGTSNVSVASSGNVSIAVAGNNIISVTASGIINNLANGSGNIGNSTGYFNTVFAKATSAQYADLAEMYVADQDYAPGTILDFGGKEEVTASQSSHSTAVAGIVSTNPSYLMNATQTGNNVVAVALVGRVPCYVVGNIIKGDRLVSSDITGVATVLNNANYQPGCIIGKALEAYNSTEVGTIEVAVGRD